MTTVPHVFVVCEGLQAPPRAGFHVHLLSLSRALARSVPVHAFGTGPGPGDPAWDAWAESLWDGPGPEDFFRSIAPRRESGDAVARKLRLVRVVRRALAREATPGSVLWVRDYSTAMFFLPELHPDLRARGVRFLYDASTLMELEVGLRPGVRGHRFRARAENAMRRRFDLVRTLGPAMRDALIATGVDPARIGLVPVGAPRTRLRWQPRDRVEKILYTGSAEEWQGLPTLVAAMRELRVSHPWLRLNVIGAKRESLGGEVPDNVHFEGWVPREDLDARIVEHDLVVLPRPRTPLTCTVVPMKVGENLALGMPLVATDLRAVREVAGEAAVYVEDPTPTGFATAIAGLAGNPERLQRLSALAVQQATDLEWDRVAERALRWLFPGRTVLTNEEGSE